MLPPDQKRGNVFKRVHVILGGGRRKGSFYFGPEWGRLTGVSGQGKPKVMTLTEKLDGRRPEGIEGFRSDIGGNPFHKIWCSDFVEGLELIYSKPNRHCYPFHLHECMEIFWIMNGEAGLKCRDRMFHLSAGDFCLLRPNELHAGEPSGTDDFSFVSMHIPPAYMKPGSRGGELFFDFMESGDPVRIIKESSSSVLMTELINNIFSTKTRSEQLEAIDYSLEKLLRLPAVPIPEMINMASRHPAIEAAKEILKEDLTSGIGINDLAHAVNLDERYFISLFKSATGLPPHQFQIALRVDHARCLIQRDIPLSQSASMAGFSDQSHLNRHFKRQYGLTPGAFRQSLYQDLNFIL